MADFKALATKLITSTFNQYQKELSICTINGSKETGTAIDITKSFEVNKSEDFDYLLATNVDQWIKPFDAGNADLVFDRKELKIIAIEQDPAAAAYFIKAKTYERQTVVIESVTETPTGSGGYTDAWATVATVQAEIEYMNGNEAIDSGRLNASQFIKMVFRYESGINEKMRVLFNGEYMPIRSIDNIGGRNEWLHLTVEKGAAG